MTEEDEEFERIEKKRQSLIDYIKEPRWKDHTKDCPNCAKMREDIDILMKRLERALSEKNQ